MKPDKAFFAWLDGELSEEDSARMAKRVAEDPELSRLAAQHRDLQRRLHGAFDPILDEPVPEAMLPRSREDRFKVVELGSDRRQRRGLLPWPMQWLAVVAALALGIFIGGSWWRPQASPVQQDAGKLYAAASLQRSLDTDLASQPRPGAVRVGITFRDQQGAICRSFTDQQSSGVACREDGRWRIEGLFGDAGAAGGDYRMAAGMDPRLADLVGSIIMGEPLNARQESAAKEHDWH